MQFSKSPEWRSLVPAGRSNVARGNASGLLIFQRGELLGGVQE